MFCLNCGKELPKESTFCPFCGAKQEGVIDNQLTDLSSIPSQNNERLIKQYQNEIAFFKIQRKKFIIIGSILTFLMLAAIIAVTVFLVFACIDITQLAYYYDPDITFNDQNAEFIHVLGLIILYSILTVIAACGLEGGIALILIGAIADSFKISKRETKIKEMEGKNL